MASHHLTASAFNRLGQWVRSWEQGLLLCRTHHFFPAMVVTTAYTRVPTFLLKKNPGLFHDFPGPPWEIFQDHFGAHECLNIKKNPPLSSWVTHVLPPFPSLRSRILYLNPVRGSGGALWAPPTWGLGHCPSWNWIWCILALKYDIWLQQF